MVRWSEIITKFPPISVYGFLEYATDIYITNAIAAEITCHQHFMLVPQDHIGTTPLDLASESGHTTVVCVLIDKGAKVDSMSKVRLLLQCIVRSSSLWH